MTREVIKDIIDNTSKDIKKISTKEKGKEKEDKKYIGEYNHF